MTCTWSTDWPQDPGLRQERFRYILRLLGEPSFLNEDGGIKRLAQIAFRDGWDSACAAHDDWVEKFER